MFVDHGRLGYNAYLFAILKFSLGRMVYAKKILLFFMNNIWERENKNQKTTITKQTKKNTTTREHFETSDFRFYMGINLHLLFGCSL